MTFNVEQCWSGHKLYFKVTSEDATCHLLLAGDKWTRVLASRARAVIAEMFDYDSGQIRFAHK